MCTAPWIPATKTTVGSFSAVALAFGRELHSRLNVPIGLIQSSWGGTRAEAWTSRDALNSSVALKPLVDSYLTESRDYAANYEALSNKCLSKWIATVSDQGNDGYLQGWAQPKVFETDWKPQTLPATMDSMAPQEESQRFDGAVWFRRTFQIPADWYGKALKLELGPISDYDDTYVNGKKVGNTKQVASDPLKDARSYRISPGILLEGQNSIAIRVFAAQGTCGFTGLPEQMRVSLWDGDTANPVPLAGVWLEKVERKLTSTEQAPHMPLGPGSPKSPGGLFNGMISPLIPYGVKGLIWYQGESNVGDADQYRVLFPALIRDWRHEVGRKATYALLFCAACQLQKKRERQADPTNSDWSRAAERPRPWCSTRSSHTGMAVAIDLGVAATIHPTNKREVGRRLSLIALSRDYGEHTLWHGPEFRSMSALRETLCGRFSLSTRRRWVQNE